MHPIIAALSTGSCWCGDPPAQRVARQRFSALAHIDESQPTFLLGRS